MSVIDEWKEASQGLLDVLMTENPVEWAQAYHRLEIALAALEQYTVVEGWSGNLDGRVSGFYEKRDFTSDRPALLLVKNP